MPHEPQIDPTDFPLLPVPTVPELRLHTAGPKSGLRRLTGADDGRSPYWAYRWGGGIALARFVLDRPQSVCGRRVLDLGTGSGIVGIAAARAGARLVVAADIDRVALQAVRMNAEANGVEISTHFGDLTGGPPPEVDIVLVGDLFYERRLAMRVAGFLDRCLGAGIESLIGDPRRRFLPVSRLSLLAEYPGPDFGIGSEQEWRGNAVFSYAAAAAGPPLAAE